MQRKLVLFCGPRGAGKGTLVSAMAAKFPELKRLVPHTTRVRRSNEVEGKDYHFVSSVEFDRMLQDGELVAWVSISDVQRSGATRSELLRFENCVGDVVPHIAKEVARFISMHDGETLVIPVLAPLDLRRKRVRDRQKDLREADIERLLAEDPVSANVEDYRDYGLVIHNDKQGSLVDALAAAEGAVRAFLRG
ncbi:MAG: hypothetical protein WC050_02610 [Candidatus Paceibacterota bacterium]